MFCCASKFAAVLTSRVRGNVDGDGYAAAYGWRPHQALHLEVLLKQRSHCLAAATAAAAAENEDNTGVAG
jgi:hypothetical protein